MIRKFATKFFSSSHFSLSPLLLTSGFPALLLIFHPDFRDRFRVKDPANRAAISRSERATLCIQKRGHENCERRSY
jgi:hypothetical protein